MLWFFSEPKEELGAPAPWSCEARRQRHRPSDLVWSSDDTLCRGRGDPHPLWRSSLVEPGAKVTVIVFTEETWWPIYTPHPGHLKLAGVQGSYMHTQEPLQAIQELSIHILSP